MYAGFSNVGKCPPKKKRLTVVHGQWMGMQRTVRLHFYLGDFADAFIKSNLQPFIHTFTQRWQSQPHRGTASTSGEVWVRRLVDTMELRIELASFGLPVNPPYLLSYCRCSRQHDVTKAPNPVLERGSSADGRN